MGGHELLDLVLNGSLQHLLGPLTEQSLEAL
jgi:hypothetical protein